MKKSIFILLTFIVLILCLAVYVFADSSSKLINSKNELKLDDGNQTVDGSGDKVNDIIGSETETNDNNKESIEYINDQYGFAFSLPKSWENYKIITDEWQGLSLEDSNSGEEIVEKGPIIIIRHPEWASENPRQDIPIMVFTLDQWNSLQQGKFHIGAAPIGPSELGRNSSFVFALPARYNYAFPTGYEEVESILQSSTLKPLETHSN